MKIELICPYNCEKCGKQYGKSNVKIFDMEVWISCDCLPKDTAYFIDLNKMKVVVEILECSPLNKQG